MTKTFEFGCLLTVLLFVLKLTDFPEWTWARVSFPFVITAGHRLGGLLGVILVELFYDIKRFF